MREYKGRHKGLSKKYKELIYIGAKFGNWEVISEEVIKHPTTNKNTIKCKCVCGVEKNVEVYSLNIKGTMGCYNCGHSKKGNEHPNFRGYKEIPKKWFSRYTSRRKQPIDINIEDVYNLWVNQNKKCALSGVDISFNNNSPNQKNYRCNASLDRIDSSKGYIKGNTQLLHKDINRMKSDFGENYFIKMCKLITENK